MSEQRERILAAAARLFEQGGLERVSMRAVAEEVGVTAMALYRHFRDKEALLDGLAAAALAEWELRLGAVRRRDPLRWLEAAALAYLDFALQVPRSFEAAFLLRHGAARSWPEDFRAGRSPGGALVLRRVEEALSLGLLRRAPALSIALSLWAQAHGLILLRGAGRFALDDPSFRRLYRSSIASVLRGWRREGRP